MTAFDVAIAGSHRIAVDATVLPASGPAGNVRARVGDGSVTIDSTAAIRRTCSSVAIDAPGLTPTSAASLLSPLPGNELQLFRGVVYTDGTQEMYSLGVFGVDEADLSTDSGGTTTVTISGSDRSKTVSENAWDFPYQVAAGTDLATAVMALIADRLPSATFSFAPTTGLVVPGLLYGTSDQDNDPWAAATNIAAAAGMELFFDANGVCTMRPVLDPSTAATSWRVGDGNSVRLLSIGNQLTRDGSYTRVVATAQSTTGSGPLRSVAALPATAVRTFYYSTAAALTQTQLDAVAAALLLRYGGSFRNVSFSTVPDPRVDVSTLIDLERAELGVSGKFVLSKLVIGLKPSDTLQATVQGGNQNG